MSSATPTILLGFLLPWWWGISSKLLQQSTVAAPYLGRGVSPYAAPPDLERGVAPLGPPAPMQPLLLGYGVAPLKVPISSVQLLSHVWLFATL